MPGNNSNETTTKFKVDISELKKGIQEANRQIRLANAEFKAASTGMDDWSNSTAGLNAKITQLESVLDSENKKLANLKEQLALVEQEQGANSKGADELRIAIANQQASINKTEKALKDYNNKLSELTSESDEVEEALSDVNNSAEEAAQGFSVMKGAIAVLIADGLKALATSVKDTMQEIVLETGAAYDSFQAKTGTATEAMGEFEDAMNEIYKNNFGESLDDIASAMAEVKQQTNETDPSKLKELTENALALRDTFDYDVKESMRAVNMLMEQFGITGEEAYNLIVQGTQKGLDKNGDLLDTINEYSVHYKQLGYDSDDFFNSLVNGAASGTFSVDKLGDAMKEFGIRTKDTATTTDEAFELLGLNAEEMRTEFAKGGEAARKASKKTLESLLAMDDQVKQNQAGVDLFGTMWEDLGIEGVKALVNTQGELKKTTKAMEDLKKVKYDNVKAKVEQIGRTVKMDLLVPLAEKLVPKVEKFVDYCITNSDKITEALKVIGTTLLISFAVNKVATFIQFIGTAVTTFTTLKTAIEGATLAQKLLNVAQAASPIGAITVAIGALISAFVLFGGEAEDAKDKWAELTEEEKKNKEAVDELSKSYDEVREAADKSVANTQTQFAYYENLKSELDGLVDANGKVKEGYEDRANFILTTLNEALGTELTMTDGIIENYQEQKDALVDLINTKKAQIILQANEQAYTDAINNQTTAFNTLAEAQENLENNTNELKKAEEEYAKIKNMSIEEFQREYDLKGAETQYLNTIYHQALDGAKSKVEGLTEKQATLNGTLEEAEDKWIGYNATIENYEGLSAAIISGDTDEINNSLNNMVNNFITAEQGNKRTLEQQVKDMKTNYENLKKAVESGAPGVTQEMVDTAKDMVDKSEAELAKLTPKGKKKGEDGAGAFTDGIKSKEEQAKKSGKKVADKAIEGVDSADTKTSGKNFVAGFGKGLEDENALAGLGKKISGLTSKIVSWFNSGLGEHSPSKITEKSGEFFLKGFAIGLDKNTKAIRQKVANVASDIVKDFNVNIDATNVSTRTRKAKSGLVAIGSNSQSLSGIKESKSTVVNNYNFNQTNNSPKALSRLEIYRQTKNQLDYVKVKGV